MKKLFLLMMLLTLLVSGCGEPEAQSEFTVKLSGTPGMQIKGAYILTTPDGTSRSTFPEIVLPQEFKIKGTVLSVSYQKTTEEGELDLEVLKDGNVVSHSTTSAPLGLIGANIK